MKKTNTGHHHAGRALQGLLMAGVVLSPAVLQAADVVWDGTTGPFGTNTNWSTDTVPGSGDNAIITNGGTATVASPDSFTVSKLFISGHSGTGNLSISGGTLTATGTPHNMYIGGDDSTGGTGVGSVTISGGSLVGNNGELLFGSRGGTGNLTMTGGTLSNNNWIIFGRDGGGTGNATLSGNATVTKTGGGNIALGVFSGTTNTVTMSDTASMTSNNEIRLGWGNNSAATKGVLNMSGNSSVSTGGNLIIAQREGGGSAGPTGELNMSGNSTATANNEFYVGSDAAANATLTMTDDSKVTVTNGFVVGRGSSTGVATVGGNAEVNIHGVNVVGDGGSSNATLVVNGNAYVHTDKQLWLGLNASTSTVTINGGRVVGNAVLDGSGLEDPTGAGVSFTRFGGAGNGTLNLNGGVLETPGFSKYAGTALINLNGGTIKATGMTTTGSFFDSIGNSEIDVQAGGAIFDTNGNNITVVQDLAGVGSLTKLGLGMLTFTGTPSYAGNTILEGGTLTINNVYLADGANVLLSAGTVLNLTFAGTDTVSQLFIDGIGQDAGTWGAIGSGAMYETSLITGTGMLFVAVPEPAEVSAAIAVGLGLLAGFRRRRGRRND